MISSLRIDFHESHHKKPFMTSVFRARERDESCGGWALHSACGAEPRGLL